MKETNEIHFPAKQIFKSCQYLPEEFSVFFVLNHEKMFSKNECVFTVRQSNKVYISVNISRRKLTFIFNDRKVDFKTSAFRDNKWHTVGFSVTGSSVVMTTDCLKLRRRKLRRTFPSYLDINNSTISIAKCDSSNTVLQVLSLFITKTRLFKYIENFITKSRKFSDKNFLYFSYYCSKHILRVLVRTASPRRF